MAKYNSKKQSNFQFLYILRTAEGMTRVSLNNMNRMTELQLSQSGVGLAKFWIIAPFSVLDMLLLALADYNLLRMLPFLPMTWIH